jgi:hypothetical protein
METVISIRLGQNLPQGERDYRNTGYRREDIRYWRVLPNSRSQSENKMKERILLTEFLQGASRSGSVSEDFACCRSSDL